jgi:hypothetical protein
MQTARGFKIGDVGVFANRPINDVFYQTKLKIIHIHHIDIIKDVIVVDLEVVSNTANPYSFPKSKRLCGYYFSLNEKEKWYFKKCGSDPNAHNHPLTKIFV